ncbi:MAG: hypothetical protein KKG60_04120 [Nanoarchaeota archaeon]|nr:hypothetical protein [Nanoarchaeota archaeon]
MKGEIKKNLLGLEYNTNLQYYNTLLIILFTYFIGVGIAFITKQIDFNSNIRLGILSGVSILVLFGVMFFLSRFRRRLKQIRKEIQKLELD